jgi:tRNA1Val (adenine37-N6)-methyltransferase
MARKSIVNDPELGELTCDRLTRDIQLFQRAKGHRFSSDDVVTAFVAYAAAPHAVRVLDLGCGIGSVLLHLAWKLPHATLCGIEAQAISFALLQRNLAQSGYASRIAIQLGDLRSPSSLQAAAPPFDLITGTPPYFPPDTALGAIDPQRAAARIEYRGGVEAYLAAGAAALSADGKLVLCGDARADDRVTRGAASCGLAVIERHDVTTWEGRPPLFSVWTLHRGAAREKVMSLVLRDRQGTPTAVAAELRAFSGFEPRPAL